MYHIGELKVVCEKGLMTKYDQSKRSESRANGGKSDRLGWLVVAFPARAGKWHVASYGHNKEFVKPISVLHWNLTAILGVPLFEEHVVFRPPASWIDGARRNAF